MVKTKTKKKAAVKKQEGFRLDKRLLIAGVSTYAGFLTFAYATIYFLIKILPSSLYEEMYTTLTLSGVESFEAVMKFGNQNLLAGFIAGVSLMMLLVFVVTSEWFNFHKLQTYKNALIWGFVWAVIFFLTDKVIEFVYMAYLTSVQASIFTLPIISNIFSPVYLAFLLIVIVMPVILLAIHNLNVKFSK